MNLQVLKKDGKPSTQKIKLNPNVFEAETNDHVVYLSVKANLANQRQGTSSVKNRTEVSGGGAKPFRQKGTGRARQGTIRSPHMVGGGRAFGPQPRDYRVSLPKKVIQAARKYVLTYKAQEKKIYVVEDFKFDKPKTRDFVDLLKKIGIEDSSKVLFLTSELDTNLYKSARNVPYMVVQKSPEFSTHDVVNADVVVFQKGALETVNEVLDNERS